MKTAGRFGVASGAGAVVMAVLGVAVAMSYHPVRPRLLCAMPLGTGDTAVYFGYTNESAETVFEPAGPSNFATPFAETTTTFLPGSSGSYPEVAFVVRAKPGEAVSWHLGPRTVRLDETTPRCPIPEEPKLNDQEVVLPKPEPPPIAKVEPPPEPPPEPPKPAEETPPPPPDRPQVKRDTPPRPARKEADEPIPLQLTELTNLEGGMNILSGEVDVLGDPGNDKPIDKAPAEVDGVVGGVVGNTGDIAPVAPPKRVAAKVKVRPKGEWPTDAPPRAGSVLVRLSLLVGVDGNVKQVKVIRGAGPAFDREAKAVGMRAVFSPATLDGEPVESWVPWDVEFTPDE